ncbi:phosphodiesterase [Rhodoferax koreense]|uniref:Phosphodiesterase n=1 Tax=Rhodoferax koreensis TaxID=1842727 RepID=A0A1P8JQZ9_9BURK|nr:HD-GYP domain-containing protein [Rhodoferax koreense]APW36170.1 phosphodiesterase [Rhodoferax koreense]
MLKRIRTQQLVLGMHLSEFCGSWMEHPFWRTKFVLTDPADIDRILASSIQEVWIDASKGLDVPPDAPVILEASSADAIDQVMQASATGQRDTAEVATAVELERAARICAKSRQAVTAMFKEARLGQAVDTAVALHVVQEITDSVARNGEALIGLARIKTIDDYTYMHSVAVCALMVALARRLGLDEAQTRSAGLAGLLHDLGKAAMPLSVLNKPGKLTDEEFTLIKSHPAKGHAMLLASNNTDETALDVCLHHHEKTDGTGYPEGLRGDEISLFARMGAVCDVYDAITSNRPYKSGWDPAESLRKMAGWAEGHFDPKVFQAFVKSLGIYPVGSLVRLGSGRIAVVMEQGSGSLLLPRVKVFFSIKKDERIAPELVDLSAPGCSEKIVGREDPAYWRFQDLNQLWSGRPGQPW